MYFSTLILNIPNFTTGLHVRYESIHDKLFNVTIIVFCEITSYDRPVFAVVS